MTRLGVKQYISLALSHVFCLIFVLYPSFCQASVDSVPQCDNCNITWSSSNWGTYRSNLYFGMRTQDSAEQLMTGILWFPLNSYDGFQNIRHSCEMADQLKYNWLAHNGKDFGIQALDDVPLGLNLNTSFQIFRKTQGEDWVNRISVQGVKYPISLIFYIGSVQGTTEMSTSDQSEDSLIIRGVNADNSQSSFNVVVQKSHPESSSSSSEDKMSVLQSSVLPIAFEKQWQIKDLLQGHFSQVLRQFVDNRKSEDEQPPPPMQMFSIPRLQQQNGEAPVGGNLVLVQVHSGADVVIDIAFNTHGKSVEKDVKKSYNLFKAGDEMISKSIAAFSKKFESVFQLQKSLKFSNDYIEFAKICFSDVMGGIGFFRGDSIVDSSALDDSDSFGPDLGSGSALDDDLERLLFQDDNEDGDTDKESSSANSGDLSADEGDGRKTGHPERTGQMELYTTTPSRSFFPRGFLWDEGFHHLVIQPFDMRLTMDMLKSWLSLMNEDGWIAREQILGDEARSKVPAEFQVQYPDFANPPTLILPVISMIRRMKETSQFDLDSGDQIVLSEYGVDPKLSTGGASQSQAIKEFLISVYPKFKLNFEWYRRTQRGKLIREGKVVKDAEVYRWRGRTATHCLPSGIDDYPRGEMSSYELHLDLTSWIGMYADMMKSIAEFLDHEQDVKYFKDIHLNVVRVINEHFYDEEEKAYGDLQLKNKDSITDGQSIVVHKGYLSLFPFMFDMINPKDHPDRLDAVLSLIKDSKQLWSNYGIRSLSLQDEYYGQGENYWRGPIWMNINFLVLRALKLHHIDRSDIDSVSGDLTKKASVIYKELRLNLIDNVYKQYKETGHLWEQYSPTDGKGQRSHPFTGWTSLIVNIMSEIY
ncbi:hypothetical protein MP228_001986 [Amoeboaphelidium protococcarum]|nr:hypothetical protein MP228_001986 [Amoeboaphelidium protococcarum]